MQIIVLACQKGGSGKTTLCASIAVAAEAAGMGPVVVIDTDPQATLTTWWEARPADTPVLADIPIAALPGKLAALQAAGYRLVIIDTPPAITASIRAVIGVASLVLIPVRPSPADLWAVGGTLELCKEQGRPFAFVVSQATRGALLTVQALAALSQHGPVCGAIIHHRVGYAGAMALGRTIDEIDPPNKAGAAEIDELLAFIQGKQDKRKRVKKEKAVVR